jgi:fructose-1,6-bisphosphatase/inositol monophosphatase family enzyme
MDSLTTSQERRKMSSSMLGETQLRLALIQGLSHIAQLGDKDLSVAVEAAVRAGAFIRDGWTGELDEQEVKEKGLGDLVSLVDLKAEEAVLGLLHAACPEDLILSEETLQATKPEPGKRMWIVDPLDGTSCFVFRMSQELVSVLIALYDCDVGRVTRAVELFPVGDRPRLIYAVLNGGAFCNGVPLSISESVQVPLSKAWVNLNHYSDVTYESRQFANLRRLLRSPGTSARMVTTLPATSGVAAQMLMGEARLSVVVHDNDARSVKQGPWDTAAVQLIVEEAGGWFLNALTGERYDTLKPSIVLIAANRDLADAILKLIAIPNVAEK